MFVALGADLFEVAYVGASGDWVEDGGNGRLGCVLCALCIRWITRKPDIISTAKIGFSSCQNRNSAYVDSCGVPAFWHWKSILT